MAKTIDELSTQVDTLQADFTSQKAVWQQEVTDLQTTNSTLQQENADLQAQIDAGTSADAIQAVSDKLDALDTDIKATDFSSTPDTGTTTAKVSDGTSS